MKGSISICVYVQILFLTSVPILCQIIEFFVNFSSLLLLPTFCVCGFCFLLLLHFSFFFSSSSFLSSFFSSTIFYHLFIALLFFLALQILHWMIALTANMASFIYTFYAVITQIYSSSVLLSFPNPFHFLSAFPVHLWLRPCLLPVFSDEGLASLHEHQEHNPQEV